MLREMLRLQFKPLMQHSDFGSKFDLERVIDDFVFCCMFVGNDFLPNIAHMDIADGALNMMMAVYRDMLPMLGGYLTDKSRIHLCRLELYMREISKREPLYFQFRAKEEKNLAWASPSYKDYYYKIKVGLEPGDQGGRRQLVQHYIEGLYWVLQYYHEGVGSWGWYYPSHYAPLGSDLVNLASLKIQFDKGRPYTPMMQLLNVLPPQSSKMLPEPYRELMMSEASPLRQYYPAEFESDRNGKQNVWESVVLIPFIDEEDLISAICSFDHRSALTMEERLRNVLGREHTFYPHGRHLSLKPVELSKIDPTDMMVPGDDSKTTPTIVGTVPPPPPPAARKNNGIKKKRKSVE